MTEVGLRNEIGVLYDAEKKRAFDAAATAGPDGVRVVAWPERLGVREGSRLLGRERLDEGGLLAGARRDDEVALSSWPIELWHDHRRARFRHPRAACGIPLGALISRSHARIGMAGRCLSASHEALGALRVIGTALASGEAIASAGLRSDGDQPGGGAAGDPGGGSLSTRMRAW